MSARRKRRREARSEGRKEGGRSGSPALLALRWLKAKESARPRTRPGRDLLPSSFLHPALSPRHATPLSLLRGVPIASSPLLFSLLRLFPSRCAPLYANNCITDALLLLKAYYAHVGGLMLRHKIQVKKKKKNSRATRVRGSVITVINFLLLRRGTY